jgi:hypothetical protein
MMQTKPAICTRGNTETAAQDASRMEPQAVVE